VAVLLIPGTIVSVAVLGFATCMGLAGLKGL
jgi:hypothetical protein